MLSKAGEHNHFSLEQLVRLPRFQVLGKQIANSFPRQKNSRSRCPQADVAKKFLKFIPDNHHRFGILTPIDSSFHTAVIKAFVDHIGMRFDKTGIENPRADELISGIMNPIRTLMRETQVL